MLAAISKIARAEVYKGVPEALQFEIDRLCAEAELPAYEISNHARPGAECRHNIAYWTGGDWAGIGPGAHGRLTSGGARLATVGHMRPADWLAAAALRPPLGGTDGELNLPDRAVPKPLRDVASAQPGRAVDVATAVRGSWRV